MRANHLANNNTHPDPHRCSIAVAHELSNNIADKLGPHCIADHLTDRVNSDHQPDHLTNQLGPDCISHTVANVFSTD